MCFKKRVVSPAAGLTAPALLLAVFVAAVFSGAALSAETLDCLLARVNDQPVTLIEIRILEAFGLFGAEGASGPRDVLDRWIDLKIVIDLIKERVSVSPERIVAARDGALSGMEQAQVEAAFRAFGLESDDLLPYFEQKLLFEEIIFMRFSRSTMVTLREIEEYYQETYVPEERGRGSQPGPLLEVLDRLEARLKAEKIRSQAAAWVQNLRRQAHVQILEGCLDVLDRE